jgi:LAO/AO transport system kinase
MKASAENWAAEIRSGDVRAISRAITAIENGDPEASRLLGELFPSTGGGWRIGITGAAGTGKSTLVGALAAQYRAQGKTVGILAVDPSSPFTGGAILGDRIRMQSHATDGGVFIRSMAARGAWGGLAPAAADAALLLDAAGKDIIVLETVGVGQDEVDVARVADCTLVVLVPGSGDQVQGLKAGLMEIADIFVLNKADFEGAAHFEEQLISVLRLAPPRQDWTPKVVCTVATEEKGIAELARQIQLFRESQSNVRRAKENEYWEAWLIRALGHRVTERVAKAKKELGEAARAVASRQKDPYAAADELAKALGLLPQHKQT